MKLIDLIELFFEPVPVQFEPMPWRGPEPGRGLAVEYHFPRWSSTGPLPGYHFHYRDKGYEWVSPARVVSTPVGRRPLRTPDGEIVGSFKSGPTLAELIRDGHLTPLPLKWPRPGEHL